VGANILQYPFTHPFWERAEKVNLLAQLLANGLVNGAMFALLAVGFGLVYRGTRIFHVAYGANCVLAAFLFHSLITLAGLNWWIAGGVAVALSAAAGGLMERLFYWPFFRRQAAGGAVMVASLGLFIAIENLLALIYGNELRTIPRQVAASVFFGPARLSAIQLAQFTLCAAALLALFLARRTRLLTLTRAMGENAELLQILGWRIGRLRMTIFAISGALAAIPSCLIMLDVGMDVHGGMTWLLLAAVAVLVGGVERMPGWIVGGFLLAALQSLVVWRFSTKWMDMVAFALLVVTLLFRKEGILSVRKRQEEEA
jgi:branched-chain amino acid transport system permease protein